MHVNVKVIAKVLSKVDLSANGNLVMSPDLKILSSKRGHTAQSFNTRDGRLLFAPPEFDNFVGLCKAFFHIAMDFIPLE